jgi:hypothetical protein
VLDFPNGRNTEYRIPHVLPITRSAMRVDFTLTTGESQMNITQNTKLRVIANGVTLNGITLKQANAMLAGQVLAAFDRAVYEITATPVYRGCGMNVNGVAIQVDVLNPRHI